MIQFIAGDILFTKANAVAHGVAPNDNFGQGLALSLREMWPSLYKDFRHYVHTANPKTGELWCWKGVGGPTVVSLFTQEPAAENHSKPGRASIPNVNQALRSLRKLIEKEKLSSVALPRLATGVGGLSWSEVEPLLATHLGDLNIPILVYTSFQKGVRAEEKI